MLEDQQASPSSSSSDSVGQVGTRHRRRVRRQSEGGLGNFLQNFGGRLNSFRDQWRDTMRPVQQMLDPRPALESAGRFLSTSASSAMTRGREMFQGGRDLVSRGTTRIREGMSDAWEGLRDSWDDLWDLR